MIELDCMKCGRTLANSVFSSRDSFGNEIKLCPICVLGKKEGSQQKYWETGTGKNAGHPEGFRYPDDTSKYRYNFDKKKKKWLDKKGRTREENAELES